jgi:hypothetical protein
MNSRASLWVRLIPLLLATAGIVGYAPVAGASLSVTNYGTDSSSCGSTTSPCRSISQAIENAASGDTIWVGAGHYGDLSGDGNFDAPGSEHATTFQSPTSYSACAICITKAVKIYSYNGAAVTTIQVGPNAITPTTVYIGANNVFFGEAGHGFTITGGNGNGVVVDSLANGGATVSGNTDINDGTGFTAVGPAPKNGLSCPVLPPGLPPACPPTLGTVLLSGNQAIGTGTGFAVQTLGANQRGGDMQFILQDNLALGTGTGFTVMQGLYGDCDDCDDAPTNALSATILSNVAANSGVGFNLFGTGKVAYNLATNNSTAGFMILNVATFTGNSAIGNAGPGAIVEFLIPNEFVGGPQPPAPVDMSQNNFFSNDRNRPPLSLGWFYAGTAAPLNPGPSAHCGVLNVGEVVPTNEVIIFLPSLPVVTTPLLAANNYWGSAQGPQPSGPGDAAGGACDQDGGATTVKPFATSPTAITPL